MKKPTNGAEKEGEVLEKGVSDTEVKIRQGQAVTTGSAQFTQSILELIIREFEPDDEIPDLEVTGEARDQEEAGAQSVVAGQESVPVAGRADLEVPHYSLSWLCKFMIYGESFIEDSSEPSEAELVDAIAALQFLMDEFGVDLACVMQSLLKNSGDFQAARHYLRPDRREDGRPLWTRHDDLALQSGDPAMKQALILKYGEENVDRRVAFFSMDLQRD
ncbi:telomeric repeat-binding factor 2-interacting protein 1-like [Acipenser oxyrinchus oxyrinchus]|uniref:Telomeric repeat-binding factor 2-interacting protein 1 n=1 Tax=Acipenser oxyrinchus oxyrinchus TaxID=40147 RepID=A0AAD8CWR7_ACIOX|nr:telomeric repeat-binding factor 2-interacting protein 1-like [Acipenser oxyrinchus oxyrinchus]